MSVRYGAIEAVRDLTFDVREGQAVAIIGANGAGKSTTLNAIGGLLKPSHGRIELDGHDITRLRADQIARLWLAQVPEGREVLASLTFAVTRPPSNATWRRCMSASRCWANVAGRPPGC